MTTLKYSSGLELPLTPKEARFYDFMGVPPPRQAPERILQRLMAFRNERKLHRRTCDFTGKEMLSAYPLQILTRRGGAGSAVYGGGER